MLSALVVVAALVAVSAETAFARGPASSKNVYVTSISAQCAGDVLSGQADASGPSGHSFSLQLERVVAGGSSSTGLSQAVGLSSGQSTYPYRFDISSLNGDGYVVRSDRPTSKDSGGSTQSRVVAASECAPPPEVPEAPIALLLPLSVIVMLGLAGAVTRRRRRRVAA